MSCEKSLELVSSLLDGRLTAGEREKAMAHTRSCGDCGSRLRTYESLRQDVRSAGQVEVPDWLVAKLHMMASAQLVRRLNPERPARAVGHWLNRLSLAFDNLARPMALPLAGGLLSALLLFGAVLQQAFPAHFRNDVQTMLSTDPDGQVVDWTLDNKHYFEAGQDAPSLQPINAVITGDSTVVELTIDPSGHVADYTIVRGELPREAINLFVWSRFTPATIFGYPTWGKTLVIFHRPTSARG
jgi:hypothetical protein